jgi:hypothetical protein
MKAHVFAKIRLKNDFAKMVGWKHMRFIREIFSSIKNNLAQGSASSSSTPM